MGAYEVTCRIALSPPSHCPHVTAPVCVCLVQEVTRRIAESDERRRLQDLKMPATQFDLERK